MEFEDHEEHDEEEEEEEDDGEEEEDEDIAVTAGYDQLGNSLSRVKMSNSGGESLALVPSSPVAAVARKPRYRECLKNHAVGLGGQAVDGCGEFMPAGTDGTLDALKCAACNCHRNFHRKETEVGITGQLITTGGGELLYHHHQQNQQFTPYYRTPAGYLHVAQQQQQHRPLALPSTALGEGRGNHQSREDEEDMSNPSGGGGGGGMMMMMGMGSSKKRYRTKFTQEQKEKMMELAERLGWRIQKHDEAVVQHFCNDTGVKRHVLKVWMHNNKHTLGKTKPPA